MRPITLVDGVCGKTGTDLPSSGMSARVPLFAETAPQRSQVARERVRREVAWHLDKPLLEVAPPQKRVAQEGYRRPPVACNPIAAISAAAPQSFRVTSAVVPCYLRSRSVLPPQ